MVAIISILIPCLVLYVFVSSRPTLDTFFAFFMHRFKAHFPNKECYNKTKERRTSGKHGF